MKNDPKEIKKRKNIKIQYELNKKKKGKKQQRKQLNEFRIFIFLPSFFTPTSSSVSSPAVTTAKTKKISLNYKSTTPQQFFHFILREILTFCEIFWENGDRFDSRSWVKIPITKVLVILTNNPKITAFFCSLRNFHIRIRLSPSNWNNMCIWVQQVRDSK